MEFVQINIFFCTVMSEIYKYVRVLMENPQYNLMNHNILIWSTKR